jgi:K+ transporter
MAPIGLIPSFIAFSNEHKDRYFILGASVLLLFLGAYLSILFAAIGFLLIFAWAARGKSILEPPSNDGAGEA